MLLPALGKAREKARAITCIGNMKQLGIAFMMYSEANNDYVVPASAVSVNYNWDWYYHLYPHLGYKPISDTGNYIYHLPEAMNPHKNIFTCPNGFRNTSYNPGKYFYSHHSYGPTLVWNKSSNVLTPNTLLTLTKVTRPSYKVQLTERCACNKSPAYNRNVTIPGAGVLADNSSKDMGASVKSLFGDRKYVDFMFGRHGKQNNMLHFDGHASSDASLAIADEYYASRKDGRFYVLCDMQ